MFPTKYHGENVEGEDWSCTEVLRTVLDEIKTPDVISAIVDPTERSVVDEQLLTSRLLDVKTPVRVVNLNNIS